MSYNSSLSCLWLEDFLLLVAMRQISVYFALDREHAGRKKSRCCQYSAYHFHRQPEYKCGHHKVLWITSHLPLLPHGLVSWPRVVRSLPSTDIRNEERYTSSFGTEISADWGYYVRVLNAPGNARPSAGESHLPRFYLLVAWPSRSLMNR